MYSGSFKDVGLGGKEKANQVAHSKGRAVAAVGDTLKMERACLQGGQVGAKGIALDRSEIRKEEAGARDAPRMILRRSL